MGNISHNQREASEARNGENKYPSSGSAKSPHSVLNQLPFPLSYVSKCMIRKTFKRLFPRVVLGQIVGGPSNGCLVRSTRPLRGKSIIGPVQLLISMYMNCLSEEDNLVAKQHERGYIRFETFGKKL